MTTKKHTGGCHCGAVRYEIELDLEGAALTGCNCSFCVKRGALGTSTKPEAFRLVSGEARLGVLRGSHAMSPQHFFCTGCGIHVFGRGDIPELGGLYVAINCNTLDGFDPSRVTRVQHWDGRHDNWDAGPRDKPWPVDAA